MEIVIGLLGLGLSVYGLFSRTEHHLREIRDVLIEIRDQGRRGDV